ncbi:MAG TPA: hypothetical protein PK122_00565 [Candidatus Paceibacterota bacterium]|nr:hypothetical protein [Candidatus Paceibacterota bacterium]
MPEKKETKSPWGEFMTKFRDIVFIILFLVTSAGWIVTSTANKTKMKVVLEETTKAVNDLKEEVKEINKTLQKQAELNGQIIQYMREQ